MAGTSGDSVLIYDWWPQMEIGDDILLAFCETWLYTPQQLKSTDGLKSYLDPFDGNDLKILTAVGVD